MGALSNLLGLKERLIANLLGSFQSVIHFPSNRDLPFRLLHLSFRDFLLQTKSQFHIDQGHTNEDIARHCLVNMRTTLKQNMCSLGDYGTKRTEISDEIISHHLQPELQYSCRYWVHHLEHCVDKSYMIEEAVPSLQKHFMHWQEAMITLDLATEVVTMINTPQLITQLEVKHLPILC